MEQVIGTRVLLDAIEREKEGKDYHYDVDDKKLLSEMLNEINDFAGTNLNYLAELDMLRISGIGGIVARYITRFSSESVRGYLLSHIVDGKVKDADRIVLDMYMHFRKSKAYISASNQPAPAHIYVRYDNALTKLKPKRLTEKLMQLAYNPRDFFYLPFTMRMLASWKLPELKEICIRYSAKENVSEQDVGLADDGKVYFPPYTFIKRQMRFTAIIALKYYPEEDVLNLLQAYALEQDADIAAAAKKTINAICKKNGRNCLPKEK